MVYMWPSEDDLGADGSLLHCHNHVFLVFALLLSYMWRLDFTFRDLFIVMVQL